SSYFRTFHTSRISAMVSQIAGLEIIRTDTELEALILESVLIKKHKPKYNVRLKDDKRYPYLRLSLSEQYPRLSITRKLESPRDLYFGPYVPSGVIRRTMQLLQRLFPLRLCKRIDFHRERPCMNYQIRRCLAPCCHKVSQEDYLKTVENLKTFLAHRDESLLIKLTGQMEKASAELEFERAASIRDQIAGLKQLFERQKIVTRDRKDRDVISYVREAGTAWFQVFFVRHGVVTGRSGLVLDAPADLTEAEILAGFIKQFYVHKTLTVPGQLVVPHEFTDRGLVLRLLAEKAPKKVSVLIPKRGEKLALLRLVTGNAQAMADEFKHKEKLIRQRMSNLETVLRLPGSPALIEAFDISTLGGSFSVGSMVTFKDGIPYKAGYRRFKIRLDHEEPNDFAMMEEVLARRYKRLKQEGGEHPDLILIDGGKGQLGVARKVLKRFDLEDLPVIGLAKREEEIFFPDEPVPLLLPKNSGALHLLQQVRDESHRFAVTYHRKLRNARIPSR
ncbi:MAG: excinuclease ABC subunit UvrC, partial [bacterium]